MLFVAALPAIGGSLLVMQAAGASRALLIQQVVVSAIAVLGAWLLARQGAAATSTTSTSRSLARSVIVLALVLVALALPMLLSATNPPHRWITVAGLRLYMSALVLPAAVLLLSDAWLEALAIASTPPGAAAPVPGVAETMPGVVVATTTVMMGVVVSAHPDASQVTALAGAMTVVLLRSWRRSVLALVAVAALWTCSLFAWQQPDPLLPVPYVEGVLDVAASAGRIAWLAALVSVALPPIVQAWHASATGRRVLLAPAVYYVIIAMMAWRQLTPMPLLGFGASPILGYFLMSGLATRARSRSD